MTIDSRRKGYTAEINARDELRKATGLAWERIPSSGALKAEHGLKGDLYVPQTNNMFCVEVKHYKDDQLTSKILSGKNPIFFEWWEQTIEQAEKVNKLPLLLFKYDRSKWFAAVRKRELNIEINKDTFPKYIDLYIDDDKISVCLLSSLVYTINKYGSWSK